MSASIRLDQDSLTHKTKLLSAPIVNYWCGWVGQKLPQLRTGTKLNTKVQYTLGLTKIDPQIESLDSTDQNMLKYFL